MAGTRDALLPPRFEVRDNVRAWREGDNRPAQAQQQLEAS